MDKINYKGHDFLKACSNCKHVPNKERIYMFFPCVLLKNSKAVDWEHVCDSFKFAKDVKKKHRIRIKREKHLDRDNRKRDKLNYRRIEE